MDSRGQIFSLDFLMAITVLVLAMGLAINYFETNTLNAKEIENQNDLWNAAKTASDVLVNHPDIVCNETSLFAARPAPMDIKLQNCLPQNFPTPSITKARLGISSAYDCNISNLPGSTFNFGAAANECKNAVPTGIDIVSIERRVVMLTNELPAGQERDINKKALIYCQRPELGKSCVLTDANISIKVWKK